MDHDPARYDQYLEVPDQGLVSEIPAVQPNAILIGQVVAAADLPQTREPGPFAQVMRDLRATEVLVLLTAGSIGVLAAELQTRSNPAGAAHISGRIGDPQTRTHSRRGWNMATRAFELRAPRHWLRLKTPRR
jgi:hypothetical protein